MVAVNRTVFVAILISDSISDTTILVVTVYQEYNTIIKSVCLKTETQNIWGKNDRIERRNRYFNNNSWRVSIHSQLLLKQIENQEFRRLNNTINKLKLTDSTEQSQRPPC